MELETGCQVRVLCLDNGELKSNRVDTFFFFFVSKGIHNQWTALQTSAHNSCCEQIHCSLADSVHSMCLDVDLPPNMWDKFIVTVSYLRNCWPMKALVKMMPFAVFYKQKPSMSHLHEIGCQVFVLVLKKHNPKIYAQSEECVLNGYGKDSKTYQVFHHPTHRVYKSYHVIFIKSGDSVERPFQPGVVTALPDNEDSVPDVPVATPSAPVLPPIMAAPLFPLCRHL